MESTTQITIALVLIVLSCGCVAGAHIFSAIKSGCFYAVSRQANPLPSRLSKYIKNLHYVQTPFWYFLFTGFGLMLIAVFSLIVPGQWLYNILNAYLISGGTSAACSPFYQGFINVGAGKPFIDSAENKSMELADPISGKTKWISRFWHGRVRILSAIGGCVMIITGILFLICRIF
jgi:hypothetical protein